MSIYKDLEFTFRHRIIILFNPNLITEILNIQYHEGVNNCAAKNFRKTVHFCFILDPEIQSFPNKRKNQNSNWESIESGDFLYSKRI